MKKIGRQAKKKKKKKKVVQKHYQKEFTRFALLIF